MEYRMVRENGKLVRKEVRPQKTTDINDDIQAFLRAMQDDSWRSIFGITPEELNTLSRDEVARRILGK